MKRSLLLTLVGLAAGLGVSTVHADRPATRTEARNKLFNVLRYEAGGKSTNRSELLQHVLSSSKREAAPHWHVGEVWNGDGWVAYDDRTLNDDNLGVRSEYRQRRQDAPSTLEGDLELADWCRKHGLRDQERVHLMEALEKQPSSTTILTRLGYRVVGGSWLSPSQLSLLTEEQQNRNAALKRWEPQLVKIRDDLGARSQRRRTLAQERLSEINDSDAVSAMELLFFRGIESEELAATRSFGRMSSYQAAHALVDIALGAENSLVRDAAVEELRDKPLEQSIPELMDRLVSPTQTAIEASYRNGLAYIRQIYYREHQYQNRVAVVDTTVRTTRNASVQPEAVKAVASQRLAEDVARQQRVTAQQINAETAQTNGRIYNVLATISDAEVASSPGAWWTWWNSEQDTEVIEKPYQYSYEQSYQEVDDRPLRSCECFCEGTPVWTEEGFVAIEKIRAGDRVLSQNVETGELTYKPVLKPTRRSAEDLRTVVLDGGETFRCTAGHPFWISGRGWVMAKQLDSGDVLHTVTGTRKVNAISGGPAAEVYNLVVADFHTYFVGRAMALSHDNAIRDPTNAVVPGLMREELERR